MRPSQGGLLGRAGRRYLLRHPWLLVLSVLGVALGVAVVVAVDLANTSAMHAFESASRALTGRATDRIVGGPRGVDQSIYRRLRLAPDMVPIAPVIEGHVTVVGPHGKNGRVLRVLGIDPLAEAPFRGYGALDRPGGIGGVDWARFLTQPGAALALAATQRGFRRDIADDTGESASGDGVMHVRVRAGGIQHTLTFIGQLRPSDALARRALRDVVVVDIATAQELLGLEGRLSHIDLILPGADGPAGARAAALARLRMPFGGRLPAGLAIVPAQARASALTQMTRAFRLNLTALSLLALVVGGFLIYNAMTFAVLQRRTLFGTLRALGVSRRELYAQVLIEAAIIGLCGTVIGLLLGVALGQGLLHLVTRTINDLYFELSVQGLRLSAAALAKGLALGLGATLLAAWVPALEAARTAPRAVMNRSALEARVRHLLPYATGLGLLLLALAGALLTWPTRNLLIAFGGLFAIIAGFALLVPLLTLVLSRVVRAPLGWLLGILGRMAARGVAVSLSRTGVAIAALSVAVATTVGVGIMIDSFRHTVAVWLEGYLRADVFISPPGTSRGASRATLDRRLVARFSDVPGVRYVSVGRRVDIESDRGITQLFVLGIPRGSFSAFRLKSGDPAAARRAYFEGEGVLVTEPYAYRHHLGVGDTVRLRTDRGPHAFRVVGVYYDYGSPDGYVTMSRRTYERYWRDRGITSLGIYADKGADIAALIERLRRRAAGIQSLEYHSNRGLREASLEIFDRTFAVTGVLRLLAIVVAFIGILSALLAIQLERARELAVLRANGLTPGQVWGLVTGETGLMGLIAGVLSLPLGVVLSLVLILVINRRSFGWSLQVVISPDILWQAVAMAVFAALLAGLYPAWRMSRTSPALALRED